MRFLVEGGATGCMPEAHSSAPTRPQCRAEGGMKGAEAHGPILVTGGAGFIGSHLVKLLLEVGYSVVVLDNLSTGGLDNLPTDHSRLRFLHGDISRPEDCRAAAAGVSAVFHLAAMSKVAPSLGSPAQAEFCQAVNVTGTMNMLQAALAAGGVRRFVYAGSSTFYGNNSVPQSESQPPDLITPYAASKYQGEILTQMFARVYGLSTCILRFFMVYGPSQPVSGAYATVNGVFLRQAMEGGPLTVHGSGRQSRDFIHVADVVRALIATLQAEPCEMCGQSINVGTGEAHSVLDVASIVVSEVASAAGQAPVCIEHVEGRPFDLHATLATTELAEKKLGWRASIRFEAGMREWVRQEIARRQYITPTRTDKDDSP